MSKDLSILSGYSEEVISIVEELISSKKLKSYIDSKYPDTHNITTDKALFLYLQQLKKRYMKKLTPCT